VVGWVTGEHASAAGEPEAAAESANGGDTAAVTVVVEVNGGDTAAVTVVVEGNVAGAGLAVKQATEAAGAAQAGGVEAAAATVPTTAIVMGVEGEATKQMEAQLAEAGVHTQLPVYTASAP
jgi:hypothetical protein